MIEPQITIEAGRVERQYWRDVWNYRGLFYFLAWRDILVRYKQTLVGVLWAFVRPFLTMVVFTVVFGRFAKLPDGGVPYPILVFSALLPWQFFSTAVTESGNSLVTNASMISKVYFPRIVVPAASIITALMDSLISFGFLLILFGWFSFMPAWQIIFLPLLALCTCVTALGCGIWLAGLTVRYRDFRFVVPFLVQFGLYVSPVGYTTAVVPEPWRLAYSLNPMVGIIEGFRWAILGSADGFPLPSMALSLSVSGLLLWTSILYFRSAERTFADVI
ncbi:MAG: ABC transporter permease [Akkermansiaceae bacterium]|nr:ABC transporter permease [Verrucomicrobiales bacterium]